MNNLILLFGSNLGDRKLHLRNAISCCIEKLGKLKALSSLYETAPWGNVEQGTFLNQVAHLQTNLSPEKALRIILDIEVSMGRVRIEKWGARLIDIDILYMDDIVHQSSYLSIPHPHLHERRFTLEPLNEILPEWEHPVLHKTNRELLASCSDHSEVKRLPVL